MAEPPCKAEQIPPQLLLLHLAERLHTIFQGPRFRSKGHLKELILPPVLLAHDCQTPADRNSVTVTTTMTPSWPSGLSSSKAEVPLNRRQREWNSRPTPRPNPRPSSSASTLGRPNITPHACLVALAHGSKVPPKLFVKGTPRPFPVGCGRHARSTPCAPYIAAEPPFLAVGSVVSTALILLVLQVVPISREQRRQLSLLVSWLRDTAAVLPLCFPIRLLELYSTTNSSVGQEVAAMASQLNPSKKPRLSLQIKTSVSPATRSSRAYPVDPKDPTAYNTLSNVYVTAIERATPMQPEPITAINTLAAFTLSTPVEYIDPKHRVTTPYVASYPETPLTACNTSPPQLEIKYPSSMTATPPLSAGPLSAGPVDSSVSKIFTFSYADTSPGPAQQEPPAQLETRTPLRRIAPFSLAGLGLQAPYTHPRALHSILRNSPLPPNTAIPPNSPRRQSLRLQEKAAKRVGYNNPLTQEITTNKYTKSHIDLLVEEASPHSPPCVPTQPENSLDLALAFTANEIQDGGQTPGPFEDMRRRMASLGSGTPMSPSGPGGVRKRKRKEKKRRWVWTLGQEDDDENVGGAIAAFRAEAAKVAAAEDEARTPMTAIPHISYMETPTPSIESTDSGSDCFDVEMSDTSSCISEDRGLTPNQMDLDLKTPTAPRRRPYDTPTPVPEMRDTPIPPEMDDRTAPKRDTPIPSEFM
ncbi:hypothetical protein G7046_g4066 [Stylonectria norvegica]|nr:hypothetical protein G7046_g4066 [Stylonectria norvegica]